MNNANISSANGTAPLLGTVEQGVCVSIVVPVYNAADTLCACIDSLLSQTHTALDIVLVDDGSPDESGRICDECAKHDPRIHVVHQTNQGRSVARWVGTQQAQGVWLTYVDADDQLMSDAIERLLHAATDDTDIVLGNARSCGWGTGTVPIDEFRHAAVRGNGTIGVPWGSLYRRSALNARLFDVPRDIYNGEDYLFWLRLVFQTSKPVRTLADSVYLKGEEHTSNSFRWTSDYSYRLNALRMESIPADVRADYLSDTINDRMTNLYATTLHEPRRQWSTHPFYTEILRDMQLLGREFSFGQRFFLNLPSRRLRRLWSEVYQAIILP